MAKQDLLTAGKILLPVGGMDESIQVVDSDVTFASVKGAGPFYLGTLQRLFAKKLIDGNPEQSVMGICQAFNPYGQYGYYVQSMEKLYFHLCEVPANLAIDFTAPTTLGVDENNNSLGIYGQRTDGTIPPSPVISCLFGFPDKPTPPPSPGTWTITGSLVAARQDHTATKLFDGRVLVVGGFNGDLVGTAKYLTSCEIYDPATGTWSATGSLAQGRYSHTATRIDGTGFVLVTGGSNGSPIGTCEIYNPSTGLWSAATSMSRTRQLHSSYLLNDNTILIVGGLPGSGAGTSEIYDPAMDTWTVKGSTSKRHLSQPFDAAGHRLSTGKIIAATYQFSDNSRAVEIYDPALGTWSLTGNVPVRDRPIIIALFPDVAGGSGGEYFADRLLLFGGASPYPVDSQLYGSGTGVWTAKGNLTQGRSRSVGVLLPGGERVLTCGGWLGSFPAINTAEIFDVNTGVWTVVAPMNHTRYAHTATLLDNDLVLVTGGDAEHVSNSTNTCELYTP